MDDVALPPMKPTWANLVTEVAVDVGLTKLATRQVLETFFGHLAEATWSTGRVVVPGLGTFNVRARRQMRVGNKGGVYVVAAHRRVHCLIEKSWRRRA